MMETMMMTEYDDGDHDDDDEDHDDDGVCQRISK